MLLNATFIAVPGFTTTSIKDFKAKTIFQVP